MSPRVRAGSAAKNVPNALEKRAERVRVPIRLWLRGVCDSASSASGGTSRSGRSMSATKSGSLVHGTLSAPTAGIVAPQWVSAPRGPVVDTARIQRRCGLAPGIQAPKAEIVSIPGLFLPDLPEGEANLQVVR